MKRFKIPADYIVGHLRGGDIILEVLDEHMDEFKKTIEEKNYTKLSGYVNSFENVDYEIEDWEFGDISKIEEITEES